MPTISMFYGILVQYFLRTMIATTCRISMCGTQDIRQPLLSKTVACWQAGLLSKQIKMVQAWIEIHKDELFADWELALAGEQPFRIAPLQ